MRQALPIILFILLGGTSCKKFLAQKSQSDLTPVTTEDYSQLLFGTGYPLSVDVFAEQLLFMDDDIQSYSGGPTDLNSEQQPLPIFSWQPDYYQQVTNNGFAGVAATNMNAYKNYYKHIAGCNIAIQYADSTLGPQADKDYLKGQAYALRAYYYLMLVNLYGRPYNDSTTTPAQSPGVPLILSSNLYETMPGRNSVAEVYRSIIADLDSAAGRLDGEKRIGDIFRINHIAAHLLASRTNLYLGQWDSVISNASYVLNYQPQLMDLNTWGVNTGWYYGTLPFKTIVGADNVETIWTYGSLGEYWVSGYNNFSYDVSVDLANQYQPDDLRAQIYFSATPPFLLQYSAPLFQGQKKDYVRNDNTFTACSFRTSEAVLNRAEAYAQKYKLNGDNTAAQNALKDLNMLRSKRFDPSTYQPLGAMTPDSLLQFCRNERRRELFQEGYHRWFDLRRYGMPAITHYYTPAAGTDIKYVLNAHDPQYTLPIPADAMLLNTNLVQNPIGPERQPSN